MGEVSTIGLDIAKSVFQVHGVDGTGAVVMRKRVGRSKVLEFFGGLSPCLVGIEACPSAHYWSRELQTLGHTVKLMPPSYVKAYLKRSKNDANDAAAICEAVTRIDAVCSDQDAGTTDWPDAAPNPTIAGTAAHDAVECDPWAYGRTRHHRGQGPQWHG
jgi:transposase